MGPRALLVEVGDAEEALSLALWARSQEIAAQEIVPAACTVLLDGLGPGALAHARVVLAQWSGRSARGAAREEPARVVEVPTVYDGEDLSEVARLWGCSVREVVQRHTAVEFTSLFCGFAPGFAYLGGLAAHLAVPRRAEPRTAVPAGSVALAGSWCGVYPTASPGGWLLIGRTPTALWDLDAAVPATLAPGTKARFVEVS